MLDKVSSMWSGWHIGCLLRVQNIRLNQKNHSSLRLYKHNIVLLSKILTNTVRNWFGKTCDTLVIKIVLKELFPWYFAYYIKNFCNIQTQSDHYYSLGKAFCIPCALVNLGMKYRRTKKLIEKTDETYSKNIPWNGHCDFHKPT